MQYRLTEALAQEPSPGNLAAAIARFGRVELEFYQPKLVDKQSPHARDEMYFVARGHGRFVIEGDTFDVAEGDAMYVPAGREHRFVDFSDDLALWVLFF